LSHFEVFPSVNPKDMVPNKSDTIVQLAEILSKKKNQVDWEKGKTQLGKERTSGLANRKKTVGKVRTSELIENKGMEYTCLKWLSERSYWCASELHGKGNSGNGDRPLGKI
jgi:hypothetical protein